MSTHNTINLNNKTRSTFFDKQEATGSEPIDSSYKKGQRYFEDSIKKGVVFSCSPGFVRGHCAGGHHFATFQYCGKEFCRDCGRDGSPIHQRRLKNAMLKSESWKSMAYLVVTIPENVRFLFYDKKTLLDFRFKLLRKLKDDFKIKEGLARWHWFGDCEVCAGGGCMICNETGSSDFWNPHLNILFPGGFEENIQDYLAPLKNWAKLYFQKLLDLEINKIYQNSEDESEMLTDIFLELKTEIKKTDLVFNYSYVTSDKMKVNRLKYVLRATFRRYNEDVKKLLYNFRNIVVWGWQKKDIEQEEAPQYCPECEAVGIQHVIKWGILERHEKNNYIKIIKNETENINQRRKQTLFRLYRRNQGGDRGGAIHLQAAIKSKRIISRL